MHARVHVRVYVGRMRVFACTYLSLSIYIYMNICMHACMHAWTYECNLCMREKEVHMIVTCV